jgi:hypothetical protein
MKLDRNIGTKGSIGLIVRNGPPPAEGSQSLKTLWHEAYPHANLPEEIREWRWRNLKRISKELSKIYIARTLKIPTIYGALYLTVIRKDGTVEYYGLGSLRVVTNVGVNAIVDAFQNLFELENFKYHGIGTGSNAESVNDTGLQTELTTEYIVDNTRATGSLGEGSSANIFRTIGTNTVDADVTIREHGIFSAAAVGSGVLLDRSVFAAISLNSGDSLQSTYDLTVQAGG